MGTRAVTGDQGGNPTASGDLHPKVKVPDANELRAFYDDFSDRRMAGYRRGNARIEAAIRRVLGQIDATSRVLEVGCGTGLITDAIASRARAGWVYAFDLSEVNIERARRSVRRPNVTLFAADILSEEDPLAGAVEQPVDCIALVDVIEHIPVESHPTLFARLMARAAPNARLVLTYPTPEYQAYLRAHEPQGLQPIDEDIHIDELVRVLSPHGFRLRRFEYIDIWRRDQYAHAVFQRHESVPFGNVATRWRSLVLTLMSVGRMAASRMTGVLFRR